MRDNDTPGEILSREELASLLESLTDDRSAREWTAPSRNRAVQAALQQASEDFAADQSRQLSNTHQCLIRFDLLGIREIEMGSFAEMLLPSDRVAVFSLDGSGARACLLISRPLLFGLMCLNFGALPGAKKVAIPDREYTRIELRFLKNLCARLLERLGEAWTCIAEFDPRLLSLQGREWVQENGHERGHLCSFDVRGFNEICRVRVLLPSSVFGGLESLNRDGDTTGGSTMEDSVLEMPLPIRVEAAARDLPLVELARLDVGESFELPPLEGGQLIVKVAGKPKFRCIRGTVGHRVAVRLTGRI